MIEHQGVYLPDGERHLVDWMTKAGEIVDGRGTYQIQKLRAAVGYCKRKRTAVDVGAHCGLWSMQLVKRFSYVHAFEPVAAHRECFVANLADMEQHVTLYPCALGEAEGMVSMVTEPTSSGDTRVDIAGGEANVPLRKLDEFALTQVDFMKLDCEGYELFALRGAEETIAGNRPVIIVEQKPGRAKRFGLPDTGAVTYLQSKHGYHLAKMMNGDYIMTP